MTPEERISQLEQAVALLLAQNGHVQVNAYDSLKKHVRYLSPGIATRGVEDMRAWLERTETVQWYGDEAEVKKFVGDDATVVVRDDVLTLVQRGSTFAVPMNGWITRNPYNGELHRSAPPGRKTTLSSPTYTRK